MFLSKLTTHSLLLANLLGVGLVVAYLLWNTNDWVLLALFVGILILLGIATLLVLWDMIFGGYSLKTQRLPFARGWGLTFTLILFCYWAIQRS